MEVLISTEAYAHVAAAVDQARDEGRELGGSILALETKDTVLLAFAVPMGPRADRSYGHVRTDADFQSRAIGAIGARVPAVNYVGDWHIHPMYLPTLSGTDRSTIRHILDHEQPTRDALFLLLGTAEHDGPPLVLGFRARRVGARDVSIDPLELRRVEPDSEEVVALLGRPLPTVDDCLDEGGQARSPGSRKGHASSTARAPWDPLTIEAVGLDAEEIASQTGARALVWRSGEDLGIRIRRGRSEAFVLIPPEYPLGAPQVFAGSMDKGPFEQLPLRYGWSSLHRLSDLVEEALEREGGAEDARSGLGSWLSGLF